MQRNWPALSTLLICLACILGCSGSGSPFDYIPASGAVSYQDGSPIPASGLQLVFITQDAKPIGDAYPRQATASPDAQGRFDSVTSYKYGDGLVPGKHLVFFNFATGPDGKLLVPQEYTHPSTSPLIVDTANLPFEIKVPRP